MKKGWVCFFKGIAAGASIGVGAIAFLLISFSFSSFTNAYWKIIPSASFSIGLILVCFLRFNLCTGKVGFALNPLLLRGDKEGAKSNFIDLLIMIGGNIVGAVALGLLFGLICLPFEGLREFVRNIGMNKMAALEAPSYGLYFLYAMACGALVYLAVYLFRAFPNPFSKAIGIIIPIGAFVYFGFHHCVANAFYFAASLSFSPNMLLSFLVSLLGNFVAALILDLLFVYLGKTKPFAFLNKGL